MKSRISSRQIAALGIGVCLFLLLVATVAVTKDSIAARDESSDAGVHTLDRSYGAWDYRAVQDANGELSVKINYDERSISGLRSFADANKKLADQLARQGGSVEVRITFRSFVDGDQFRSWVKTNGIRVSDSMLGAYDRKNYGISLGVSAQGQDALPQDAIERGISSL